ncbi:hypothetical protein M8J77_017344 [Diaphorina citri]|nr:hypothetical protein M8J77_017344 [Diaphorina citri]
MSKLGPSKDKTLQKPADSPVGSGDKKEEKPIEDTILSEKIAAECLCLLGNTYLGDSYAYLKLDARERMLTNIDLIGCYQYIQFINLNNNLLNNPQLKVLAKIPCVIVLEINENLLETTAIPKLPFLQALIMKSNRIRQVVPFDHENLGYIDLQNNQISSMDDRCFQKLPNLLKMSIGNNLLTTTAGIKCESLVFLYLQNNRISKIHGLEHLVNLEVLNLRGNQIERLGRSSFPPSLSKLHYLNLRRNKIRRVKDFRRLKRLPSLTTLLCFENAYDKYGDGKEVRDPILVHLKRLRRLNKTEVTAEEWDEVERLLDSSCTDSSAPEEAAVEEDVAEEENAADFTDDIISVVSWTLDKNTE